MELVLIVWLVMTALPALKVLGVVMLMILIAAMFFSFMFGYIPGGPDEEEKKMMKSTFKNAKWVIPVIILCSMLPNEKTSWYMVGAYGTQKIVESPVAQELAADGVDVMKSLLARAKAEIAEVPKK